MDLTGYVLPVSLAASLTMALPVSTPPNAMAHATGELSRRDFLQTAGFIGLAGTLLVLVMTLTAIVTTSKIQKVFGRRHGVGRIR